MRRYWGLLPMLAATAGCAAQAPGAIPAPIPSATPSATSPSAAPSLSPGPAPTPSEPDYLPPDCDHFDDLAVAPVGRDAAAGTQYLILTFVNCSSAAVSLADPTFLGVDADGAGGPLGYALFDPGNHPTPTLQPGQAAGLEMNWANNGRCERGVQRLTLEVAGRSFDLTQDCLLLGGEYAAERDETLSLTWNPSYWQAPAS